MVQGEKGREVKPLKEKKTELNEETIKQRKNKKGWEKKEKKKKRRKIETKKEGKK